MSTSHDVLIGLLSPDSFATPAIGYDIFALIQKFLPAYMPEKYGNYEPLKNRFGSGNINDLLTLWQWPFLWKSKKGTSEGNIFMKGGYTHSAMYISGNSRYIDLDMVPNFLKEISLTMTVDYAYIHLFTQTEYMAKPQEVIVPHRRGIAAPELLKFLPDLSWGTIWGAPYIELFGRDTLLTVPAYEVYELNAKSIYVQLSKSMLDLKSNYVAVDIIREQVKNHLNSDVFYQPERGKGYRYTTVAF